ncbi:MAG: enoyl-CoA hydratase/isomerase family protein [Alphaproteobacteria bacterium]|jgi:enoyl-CoA hydratase/carnithine racemase|nr:enoyl-CoA hydratase/isomerase family protein [Alphaproteobacteria bacterium]
MTEAPLVLTEDADSIRLLTLNRPEKLNALNTALVTAIIAAIDAADADDAVAVVILTGSGRAFSAGADMTEAQSRAGESTEAARRHAETLHPIYQIGTRTDKPVIAAVTGYALGGGCNLAIACDMAVAGESAVFGYPELRRGLAATMVTPGLVHRLGPKAAFELLTLAENVSAERALALGLVNRVVADDAVIDEARAMAAALAAFDGPALRTTKRVFQAAREQGLTQSLETAREAMLLMRELTPRA